MKFLFLLSIFSLSVPSFAASTWKVVAETTNCEDKIQILAKEGEKYVLAVNGNQKTKLFNQDGSAFEESPKSTTIYNNTKSNGELYTFIQPSIVEGNAPKINVSTNGEKSRCRMKSNQTL